jgi:hypothetical protein
MVPNKSLDDSIEIRLIVSHLCDAHALYGLAFNKRALRLTCQKVRNRTRLEGLGFLTKTLPRLCRHLDQVLAGAQSLNPTSCGFDTLPGSKLPRFLGELFGLVFQSDGVILPDPDAKCVRILRQVLTVFGKYRLPYEEEEEQKVIQAFKDAEGDLSSATPNFALLRTRLASYITGRRVKSASSTTSDEDVKLGVGNAQLAVIREARMLIHELFRAFDPMDIQPRHGPGVVATKQRLSEKFQWSNVCSRITSLYPFDAYFCASLGHVCDAYGGFDTVRDADLPAQVLLVPKDSRGPRLISCEPVDFQWIQQGLRQAIYELVENHALTKHNVFFTDQVPNRCGALLGSSTGRYATLDLKEASDRVHLDLVRLLFPEHICAYLEAARSTSTKLPSGEVLPLSKFAPMGSALCFPVMALTIWALLAARSPNADTRESILVYGDDVIVPTAFAGSAITVLEAFGLKINHAKSCTQGLFRESCGMDAFKGVCVTPTRIKCRWAELPSADAYESWIAYANQFFDKRMYSTYNTIVAELEAVYGPIPDESMNLSCPSLRVSSATPRDFKRRTHAGLQKVQYKVRVSKSRIVNQVIDGWSMLLRYFSEAGVTPTRDDSINEVDQGTVGVSPGTPFSVSSYTKRGTSMLVFRWR